MLDPPSLIEAFKDIDVVYHLAALVSDWAPREAINRVIVDGSKNITQAAINAGVKRMMYMSSLAVHGLNGHNNADENTPFNPDSLPFFPYAKAKATVETHLVEIGAKQGLEIVRVRPGYDIIGPRNTLGFIPMANALETGTLGFLNGGTKLICLVYVKNLVAGMVHLANLPEAAGEAYIISDVSWTWKQYFSAICDRLGCSVPKLNIKYGFIAPFVRMINAFAHWFKTKNPPILTRYRIAIPRNDIDFRSDKIISTGFKAPYTFEEGLDEAVAWYKATRDSTK